MTAEVVLRCGAARCRDCFSSASCAARGVGAMATAQRVRRAIFVHAPVVNGHSYWRTGRQRQLTRRRGQNHRWGIRRNAGIAEAKYRRSECQPEPVPLPAGLSAPAAAGVSA